MSRLFRILWVVEMVLMLWWLWDEWQLEYLPVNVFVWYGFVYLLIARILWVNVKWKKLAVIMVAIPGVVIAFMLFFVLLIILIEFFDGPIRWN